jgi:hypothetical protein
VGVEVSRPRPQRGRPRAAVDRPNRLASDILAKALAAIEGHPWAEWGRNEKAITPTGVARLLKRYAIVPDSVRIGGRTPKGYRLDQFSEAFSSYLRN